MFRRFRKALTTNHGVERYIPFATDLPRTMHPTQQALNETYELAAISGLAEALTEGPEAGLIRGAITGMGHRTALGAAWDEYYKVCAEADERNRRGSWP
jgi:hypothetical protein